MRIPNIEVKQSQLRDYLYKIVMEGYENSIIVGIVGETAEDRKFIISELKELIDPDIIVNNRKLQIELKNGTRFVTDNYWDGAFCGFTPQIAFLYRFNSVPINKKFDLFDTLIPVMHSRNNTKIFTLY